MGDWKYFDLNPRNGVEELDFSKIVAGKVSFYQEAFADVDELKKYFSENNRAKFFLTHLEFPNNLSENEMLEMVKLLDSERFDTNFMRPIRQLPAKFLTNSEIVSKYNNLTENVKPITLYFDEFNNVKIYNFHEKREAFGEAKYDSKNIFINIGYWLGKSEGDGFDVTQILRLSNMRDLDYILVDEFGRNPPISVIAIGDGAYTKWLSAYADIREPLYDQEIFIKILQKLQNYKKFANELHIYGLKKEHFENEKILEILTQIPAKNIIFHLEHGSSFELNEKFYEKLLNAKTEKTIAFEVFGVGGEGEFFCNFIAENSEKSKIINRDGRPFLFCFAETAKVWDEEENKKREIRDKIAK